MNLNLEKFKEFQKKVGFGIDIKTTSYNDGEIPTSSELCFNGTMEDMIKILNIIMTH